MFASVLPPAMRMADETGKKKGKKRRRGKNAKPSGKRCRRTHRLISRSLPACAARKKGRGGKKKEVGEEEKEGSRPRCSGQRGTDLVA